MWALLYKPAKASNNRDSTAHAYMSDIRESCVDIVKHVATKFNIELKSTDNTIWYNTLDNKVFCRIVWINAKPIKKEKNQNVSEW
jgi:hypothetical protein